MSSFWIGQPYVSGNSANPTFGNAFAMSSAAHKTGWTIRAPKTGTLNRFGARLGTVGNVPDNGLRLSFQDLSAGLPDGTQDQYADITSGIATGAWLEPTDYMGSGGLGSGSKRSVTVGDYLGLVVEFVSFVASDSVNMATAGDTFNAPANQNYIVFTTGWGALTNSAAPIGLLYDGDTDYTPLSNTFWCPWADFITDAAYSSSSTPDERALRFQVPWDCVINGVEVGADWDGNADVVIYDSDGTTPLATVTQLAANRLGSNPGFIRIPFPDTEILANTTYTVSVKPITTTALQVRTFTVPTTAHMAAMGGGKEWYYRERTDAGSWSDTTTKRPWIRLQIKEIVTDGGGSPGGSPGAGGGGQHSHVF